LADGTLKYEETQYIRETFGGGLGIEEWCQNLSLSTSVRISSLSSTVVKFETEYVYSPIDVYLKASGVVYHPDSDEIVFVDSNYSLVHSSGRIFNTTTQVDKETGLYTLTISPHGAIYSFYESYYTHPYSYTQIMSVYVFAKVGDQNEIFLPNASDFSIGTIVNENYTVTGESEYLGVSTWVVEPKNTTWAFGTYEFKRQFEKNSGVLLREDVRMTYNFSTMDYETQYIRLATDFTDVIGATPLNMVSMVSLLAIGAESTVGAVLVVAMWARRRRPTSTALSENGNSI
jgi:hypothetical protein